LDKDRAYRGLSNDIKFHLYWIKNQKVIAVQKSAGTQFAVD